MELMTYEHLCLKPQQHKNQIWQRALPKSTCCFLPTLTTFSESCKVHWNSENNSPKCHCEVLWEILISASKQHWNVTNSKFSLNGISAIHHSSIHHHHSSIWIRFVIKLSVYLLNWASFKNKGEVPLQPVYPEWRDVTQVFPCRCHQRQKQYLILTSCIVNSHLCLYLVVRPAPHICSCLACGL